MTTRFENTGSADAFFANSEALCLELGFGIKPAPKAASRISNGMSHGLQGGPKRG